MRLVFINRFYWPETPATGQLLTDLAEAMARTGHEVTVITSHSGAAGLPAGEHRHAVRVHRVRGTRWSQAGLIGKACDWGTFYVGALWRLGRVVRRDSMVIAMTDPPLLGIGAWLVARSRGAGIVHWVQDIYPELAIELAGQHWLRLLRPVRNAAWRRADCCVTLGGDMARVLASAPVDAARRAVIPNWAPAGLAPQPRDAGNPLRARWGFAAEFVIAYSGNLGRVHDLDAVLAIAEALRDDRTIALVIVGDGAQLEALKSGVAARRLPNVSFHPPQPRDDLAAVLAVADLHLVTLRPGCERLVFPSKLYGAAAVGRPVLFIGPAGCEMAGLIHAGGFGAVADRGDTAAIAESIRRLQRDDATWMRQAAAAARFAAANDFSRAFARWRQLLESVHACRPAALTARPDISHAGRE